MLLLVVTGVALAYLLLFVLYLGIMPAERGAFACPLDLDYQEMQIKGEGQVRWRKDTFYSISLELLLVDCPSNALLPPFMLSFCTGSQKIKKHATTAYKSALLQACRSIIRLPRSLFFQECEQLIIPLTTVFKAEQPAVQFISVIIAQPLLRLFSARLIVTPKLSFGKWLFSCLFWPAFFFTPPFVAVALVIGSFLFASKKRSMQPLLAESQEEPSLYLEELFN